MAGDTKVKIDRKLNFTIPVKTDEGSTIHIFIPQPSKAVFVSVARILQKFYTLITQNVPLDVIVTDYELFIEEAIAPLPDKDKHYTAIKSFLDKSLSGAYIFIQSKCEFMSFMDYKKHLSEESLSIIEGTFVFISALYRYTSAEAKTTILKDYYTSLSYSEWMKYCESLFKKLAQTDNSTEE